MPWAPTETGKLYYEALGSGSPVILVSGLGGLANFWRLQTSDLAQQFRVLTYDHRGSGQSTRSSPPYSIHRMAEDLLMLMDHLELELVHLIGHSLGGAICQHLAVTNPGRIGRLVLSATWTHCDPYLRRLFKLRQDILQRGDTDTYARLATLLIYSPDWISDHDTELAEVEEQLPKDLDPYILAAKIEALLTFDRRRDLSQIACPTLIVAARDDVIIPIHFARTLAQTIPNAHLHIMNSGGHYCPVTCPMEYNTVITEFLARP